jgi:uncharacterized protein
MSDRTARRAIDRAVASLAEAGTLELGFFGGEPLLEADLIAKSIDYAVRRCCDAGASLRLSMTTNGTQTGAVAWGIMLRPDMDLAVSCDGLPETHDRLRITPDRRPTSQAVLETIRKLIDAGKDIRVVMVVRPDTVLDLPAGIVFLQSFGVHSVDPSLDLWTNWRADDVASLCKAVALCARIWRDGLPDLAISWFDEKAAQLLKVPCEPTARCGFGAGEIAVAPSGNLYPCERLIGEDRADNPARLIGHANDGTADFLNYRPAPHRSHEECADCQMQSMCNTFCRCSNLIRSGDPRWPDGLLCAWNQACLLETAAMLRQMQSPTNPQPNTGAVYATTSR